MLEPPPHARLTIDTAALAANWQRFAKASGTAACGAAIKADGYGLGGQAAFAALYAGGAREFFVAHWHEAAALGPLPDGARLAVLHGVADDEMAVALASAARPVLVTAAQVAAWKPTLRPCDVMVDTGLNRLGLSAAEALSGLLDGLVIDTLHSHLACAEEYGHPLNARQVADFAAVTERLPGMRHALANSAGIGLGADYCFTLTRPGIGLFGGGLAPDGGRLAAVAGLEARIIQLRDVPVGQSVGYGATFVAQRPTRIAVVALGYADGYARSLSNRGAAIVDGVRCPVAGRVAMDLTAFDVTDAWPLAEGDWLTIDFDLAAAALASGRSEYELLTGLGARYARVHR
jgi:alanine racemase